LDTTLHMLDARAIVDGNSLTAGGDVIIAINRSRIVNGDDLSTYLEENTAKSDRNHHNSEKRSNDGPLCRAWNPSPSELDVGRKWIEKRSRNERINLCWDRNNCSVIKV
jgi:hypothetical protein